MKIKFGKNRSDPYELNMTSMIDVVFLLLIFFICTSSFNKPEDKLDIASTTPGESSQQVEFEPVRIALSSNSAGVVIMCDNTLCNDMLSLLQELDRRRQMADVPIIVEGEGPVPFESMVQAVETAKHAKFMNVAFSVGGGR